MKTPHPDPKIRRASQLPQYDREIIVRMLREQISLYLKKRRKGKYSRYSLRRFARDCGIHIETLRKLRRGHTINPKVLEKVLRKMQIKPSIALRFVPNRHVFRKMLPARKPIKPWKRPSQRKKKKPRTRSTKPVPLTKTLVYVLRADKRLAKFLGGADRVLVKWARKQLLDILATSVNRRKELILTGRGSEIDYGGGIRFTPTTEKEKEAAVVLERVIRLAESGSIWAEEIPLQGTAQKAPELLTTHEAVHGGGSAQAVTPANRSRLVRKGR